MGGKGEACTAHVRGGQDLDDRGDKQGPLET